LRFTVLRPASAEVSPCCHRPPGGDVACRVHIGIARPRAAGDTLENRLALTVSRRDVPALGASLRRIRCRDEFQPPRGLVLQPGHQQTPPLAADLTVEAPFLRDVCARAVTGTARRAGHRTHLQVLDTNGVKAARHLGTGLFHPVMTPICLPGAHPRNGQLRSRAAGRSAPRPSQPPLQAAQALGFTSTKASNTQQLSVGQGNRDRHAAVNTHHAAITGSRDGVGDGGKSDVPAPRAIPSDSVGLHGVGDGAGPAEAHPTDLGDPDLPVAAAQPRDEARSDTNLAESFVRLLNARKQPKPAHINNLGSTTDNQSKGGKRRFLPRLKPGVSTPQN
jgi:hypothetical protein